jgi:ankyrin repeat protein
MKQHSQAVETLLEHHINPNVRDDVGGTPLMYADYACARLLIQHGADVNAQDREGKTVLASAISKGNDSILVLLQHGAKSPIKDNKGKQVEQKSLATTALLLMFRPMFKMKPASSNLGADDFRYPYPPENLAFVEALLDKGADINVRDQDGSTLLYDAISGGKTASIRLLLKRGVDVNAHINVEYVDGFTALMFAIENHDQNLIKELLASGADINVANTDGDTALVSAIEGGDAQCVKFLLEKGAKVNLKGWAGFTPLSRAKNNHNPEMIRLLKQAGAKE